MNNKELPRKTETAEEPREDSLIAALEQNWLHARHEETQRFWLLNVYLLISLGIISLLSTRNLSSAPAVVLLFFLFIVSLCLFLVLIKLNAEFSNHIRAVQWIAEKLKLIKEIQCDTSIDKKIMFKGFMALPLPLPVRAHEIFFTHFPLFITGTSLVVFVYSVLTTLKIVRSLTVPLLIILIVVFMICILGLYFWILKRVKKISDDILKGREPDGMRIQYP